MMNGANWDAVEAKLTPRWVQEKVGLLDAELEGERARRETAEAQPGGRRKGGIGVPTHCPLIAVARAGRESTIEQRIEPSARWLAFPPPVWCAALDRILDEHSHTSRLRGVDTVYGLKPGHTRDIPGTLGQEFRANILILHALI